jgi:hypothetical protein
MSQLQTPQQEPLEDSGASSIPKYYTDCRYDEINHTVHNLDDVAQFKILERKVVEPMTNNFIVDFGDEEAWSAFDLGAESIKKLLRREVSVLIPCRGNAAQPYARHVDS